MALRLIIEVEGDDYRVVHKQPVDMTLPNDPPGTERREGIVAELRNDRDETLHAQNVSAQLDRTVEVFSPDGHVERIATPDQKRTIMLLLPDDADARSLVFLRRRVSEGRGLQETTEPEELKRIPLTDDE